MTRPWILLGQVCILLIVGGKRLRGIACPYNNGTSILPVNNNINLSPPDECDPLVTIEKAEARTKYPDLSHWLTKVCTVCDHFFQVASVATSNRLPEWLLDDVDNISVTIHSQSHNSNASSIETV